MPRHVALLRGIAPGLPHRSNAELRGVLERLGLDEVGSVLSSGNIVFTATGEPADFERRIEEALTADLGLASRALVRSGAELRALVDTDPFAGLTHDRASSLMVTFVRRLDLDATPEGFDPGSRVVRDDEGARVVLAVLDDSARGRSRGYLRWLERTYGKQATTRSWPSVIRILRRLES